MTILWFLLACLACALTARCPLAKQSCLGPIQFGLRLMANKCTFQSWHSLEICLNGIDLQICVDHCVHVSILRVDALAPVNGPKSMANRLTGSACPATELMTGRIFVSTCYSRLTLNWNYGRILLACCS